MVGCSDLGDKASPSVVALAQSSKHIVQIILLLEERRLSFSFCLNKNELLLLAGFGLLFQSLDLDCRGKLIQDSQRLLCSIVEILERNEGVGAIDFKKIACAIISVDRIPRGTRNFDDDTGRRRSDERIATPPPESKVPVHRLQNIASRNSTGSTPVVKCESSSGRRFTAPILPTERLSCYDDGVSQTILSSAVANTIPQHRFLRCTPTSESPPQHSSSKPPNLDYLSFNDPTPNPNNTSPGSSLQYNATQQVQAPLDSLFPSEDDLPSYASPPPSAEFGWCSDIWDMPGASNQADASHGHMSFSEEAYTSGEEFSSGDMRSDFQRLTNVDGLVRLDALDGNFGL